MVAEYYEGDSESKEHYIIPNFVLIAKQNFHNLPDI